MEEMDEPVDMEARSPELGLKYKDMAVIDQMINLGADMARPRHIIYYVYFSSQAESRAAAKAATERDFDVTVREPGDGVRKWSVRCERHDYLITPDGIRDNTDFFEALAESYHGSYDGWEAALHPKVAD